MKRGTDDEEALIHVICAEVILKSRPIGAVITVQIPYRKEDVPMDIVAVRTKRHSRRVVLKHAGLLPASACGGGRGSVFEFTVERVPSKVAMLEKAKKKGCGMLHVQVVGIGGRDSVARISLLKVGWQGASLTRKGMRKSDTISCN